MEVMHTEVCNGFTINTYFLPEYEAPDDTWDSEQDKIDVLTQIDNGSLLYFCAKVTAEKCGIELASDYLGQCIYESVNDFLDGGYYEDMKTNVVADAEYTISELVKGALK